MAKETKAKTDEIKATKDVKDQIQNEEERNDNVVDAGTTKVEEVLVAPNTANTTASIHAHNKQKTNAQLAAEVKVAKKKFEGEKTVKVSIPSALSGQLGSTQYVAVNGVHVNVPVDGEEYDIPETHANVLKEMLRNLK